MAAGYADEEWISARLRIPNGSPAHALEKNEQAY